MSDEEIQNLVQAYGFTGEQAERAMSLCREVERTTRQGYFALIQCVNNAAVSRDVTSRELDKLLWDHDVKKKKGASGGS